MIFYWMLPNVLAISLFMLSTLVVYTNVNKENRVQPVNSVNSCTTPLCKNAVKKLEESIDPTVDPCDDIYQFTCGAPANSSDFDYESEIFPQYVFAELQRQMNAQLISNLEKDHHVNDTKPMKVVKDLYKSCVNESANEEQSLASFLNIMEQVGGWPVLKGDTWNETAFDWTKLIFKNGDENDWVISCLPIVVMQDRQDNSVSNIYVDEPNWEFALIEGTKTDEAKKYLQYMIDIAVSMGANETYARSEMNKTFQFEFSLVSYTSTGQSIIDKNYFNTNKNQLNIRVSLLDLEREFPFISWKNYITSKLPLNVTLKDIENRIIVSNFEYINCLNSLISATEKRVVANYFVWKKFQSFAFKFGKNTSNTMKNYNSHGSNKDPASTECLTVVETLVPRALDNLYVHENFDNQLINFTIFFNDIRKEIIELLRNSQWIQDKTKEIIVDKIMAMSYKVNFPENFFEDSLLTDKNFQNLQTTDDNYFMNLFNINKYIEKLMWKNLDPIAVKELEQSEEYDDRLITPHAFYNDRINSVIFIPALLQNQEIIYNNDFPTYMNYGKLGYVIGHEIASSFGFASSTYDKNFKKFEWQDMSHETYMDKLNCLFMQYGKNNFKYTAKLVNENFVGNTGLRATYNAYKKFSMMDVSQELKGKNYTPKQLFWISVANSWCEKPNATHFDFNHIPSRSRVHGTFSNIEEFANDFSCPKGSPMNPLNKCRIL